MEEMIRTRRKKTARFMAEKLDVDERTIRRYWSEPRKKYENRAAERRRIAGTMFAAGNTWPEIAETLECTEWAARALVRRYRIECEKAEKDPNTGDLLQQA